MQLLTISFCLYLTSKLTLSEFYLNGQLSVSFPFLRRFAPTFYDQPSKLLESTFRQVIETRKESGEKSMKDFLDLLCDLWELVPSKEFQDLGISQTNIISQAVNFFLGGYDTMSTVLCHLFLHMAENPEVQEKMHLELTKVMARKHGAESGSKSKDEIDHNLIQDSEIPYIIACINESMRLAPPIYRPERVCTKDWSHNGISIKKDTVVMLAAWPANRNSKVYLDEPDKYKPERFLPENKTTLHPYAFSSFGFGPRRCIGMRFGYETLKIFVCYFVKNFRVEKRADTFLKYRPGSLIIVNLEPLFLDLVQRKV